MGQMYAEIGYAKIISYNLYNWVKSILKYVMLAFILGLLIDPVSKGRN